MSLQDLAHGLKELLTYEGDVEDDLCMTFQVSEDRLQFVLGREISIVQLVFFLSFLFFFLFGECKHSDKYIIYVMSAQTVEGYMKA